MVTKLTLLILSAALAGAMIACGEDDDGDAPTPVPSATRPASTGEPANTPEPDPAATGLEAIVEAARDKDAAALEALVRYEPVPCTTNVQGIGGPPECEPGEADGTPVDVVFATECEGYYAREGLLSSSAIAFGQFGSGDPVYGVYEIDPASQLARVEPWADARFAIVMNRIGPADQNFAYVLISDGEQIIGTAAGCGETPEEWVELQALGAIEVP